MHPDIIRIYTYCCLSYKPFINNDLNKISSNIKINNSKLFKFYIIINVSYAFSFMLVFTSVIICSIICLVNTKTIGISNISSVSSFVNTITFSTIEVFRLVYFYFVLRSKDTYLFYFI